MDEIVHSRKQLFSGKIDTKHVFSSEYAMMMLPYPMLAKKRMVRKRQAMEIEMPM